jgi:hypothetical protein
MIRKGQVLGITKTNLRGQARVFGALLGLNERSDRNRKLPAHTISILFQYFPLAESPNRVQSCFIVTG